MVIRFTDQMTPQAEMMSQHEMDMNIRVLEGFIENRVEERSMRRSLSEIEEYGHHPAITENCLRFHEAVTQMNEHQLSVREAKEWMICAVSAIRTAYDQIQAELLMSSKKHV